MHLKGADFVGIFGYFLRLCKRPVSLKYYTLSPTLLNRSVGSKIFCRVAYFIVYNSSHSRNRTCLICDCYNCGWITLINERLRLEIRFRVAVNESAYCMVISVDWKGGGLSDTLADQPWVLVVGMVCVWSGSWWMRECANTPTHRLVRFSHLQS